MKDAGGSKGERREGVDSCNMFPSVCSGCPSPGSTAWRDGPSVLCKVSGGIRVGQGRRQPEREQGGEFRRCICMESRPICTTAVTDRTDRWLLRADAWKSAFHLLSQSQTVSLGSGLCT